MRSPIIVFLAAAALFLGGPPASFFAGHLIPGAIASIFVSILLIVSIKTCYPWEQAIVVRLGRFQGIRKPGLFFLLPGVDSVLDYVDTRIQSMSFKTEKALTSDGVSVDVEAIVFWQIFDPRKAALEVKDYDEATSRVAQTTMRETIGASQLTDLLSNREQGDKILQESIDRKTHEWGIGVRSVEIRDVSIPATLNDAMSRSAQAVREKDARVTLASAELEIAEKTALASAIYADNPIALQLRQMSLVYEMGKNSNTIIVPSDMAASMGGNVAAIKALEAPRKE